MLDDLISVIVPIYNVEKYIEQCLNSLIDQTYKNIEIILIDDGSIDESGNICDVFMEKDERIRVIHKENGGVSSARNAGLDVAKGKWICFVDPDDYVERQYCYLLLEKAKEKNADIVLCGYHRVVNEKLNDINSTYKQSVYTARQYMINTLNPQTAFGFCHMKLYKKECIDCIRFNESIKVGEDALFNIMVSNNISTFFFLDKMLYNYRVHSNSVVRKFDQNYVEKYANSLNLCKEYLLNNYAGDAEIMQNYYNYVVYHVMLIAVNYCYNPKNIADGKEKSLKKICNYENFKYSIKNSDYKNISITRKIMLFCLKNKLYHLAGFICKFRQKQNKEK